MIDYSTQIQEDKAMFIEYLKITLKLTKILVDVKRKILYIIVNRKNSYEKSSLKAKYLSELQKYISYKINALKTA